MFVTPGMSRDVPEMLKQLEQEGHRVGKGVMLISKHLVELVRNVLNPRCADLVEKRIFTSSPSLPKNTFFPKSATGRVMVLPGAPGGQFRQQGLSSAKPVKASAWNSAQDATTQRGLQSQTDSIESRPTRSTGDLPKQVSPHRPNTCDRQTRQPLKCLPKELLHRQHDSPSDMPSSSADICITSTEKTIAKDSLEELEVTRVRALANMVIPKLKEAKVKGNRSAASQFLSGALASLQGSFTLKEAEKIQKKVHLVANKPENQKMQRSQEVLQRKKEFEQWKKEYKKSGGNPVSDEEFFKNFT